MTSSLVLACVLLGSNPPDLVLSDRVDLIEVNHYYDEQGRHVFDQTIYYDWCSVQCRYNVRAWRLVKSASQLPTRDARTHKYVATWHDGGVLRRVVADGVRETWTQYDPELVEQEFLPKDQRRDLCKPLAVLANPGVSAQASVGPLRPASEPRTSTRSSLDTVTR